MYYSSRPCKSEIIFDQNFISYWKGLLIKVKEINFFLFVKQVSLCSWLSLVQQKKKKTLIFVSNAVRVIMNRVSYGLGDVLGV